jgi:hypothetical protein
MQMNKHTHATHPQFGVLMHKNLHSAMVELTGHEESSSSGMQSAAGNSQKYSPLFGGAKPCVKETDEKSDGRRSAMEMAGCE